MVDFQLLAIGPTDITFSHLTDALIQSDLQ